MIIDNTQPRMYICAFTTGKSKTGLAKVILKPKLNTVKNSLAEDLLKHPGFKARLDVGILKIVDPVKSASRPEKEDKTKESKAKEDKQKDK